MNPTTFGLSDRIRSNDEFLSEIERQVCSYDLIGTNKKIKYLNVPASFDIETSSVQSSGLKMSLMYEWSFGINGIVTVGRTWEEYKELIENVENLFGTSEKVHLVVYVHNLSYEFQFIRKLFEWEKVFSLDVRKPVYAIPKTGIDYSCS